MCPSGGTKYVSFELFLGILSGPGEGRGGAPGTVPSQRALRDILMPRGKNWLPTVSRQFLTRNYLRPNCLLKCLPNCLAPTIEDIFSSFKIAPVVRAIARQLSGKNCLAAIFASRHQYASPDPLGLQNPEVTSRKACLRSAEKQQKKAPCRKFLSGTSQGRGQWVPDIPGISCPKTLTLGCFFLTALTLQSLLFC